MKKYKLIKTYPNSPKLGEIFTEKKYPHNNIFSNYTSNHTFYYEEIKNYPEFWQEVVEKDYEILSFKQNSSIEDLWLPAIGGWSRKGYITIPMTTEEILNRPDMYSIHSVKRLSDGEIFTVGDYINYHCSKASCKKQIINILIKENTIKIVTDDDCEAFLWMVHHYKNPLFTTEDGVDIFEGDKYFTVYNMKDNKGIYKTWKTQKTHFIAKGKTEDYCFKDIVYFSMKEKAEEYILMNKPCLSLNDVIDRTVFISSLDELKKTVKSRINGKAKERIEQLKLIKNIRDKGELLCIPYYNSFPKLSKFVPGIVKGIMYKVTANSGVGKTQLTKQLFVLAPLNYLRRNPDTKIKIKIFYFALEESEEEFIDSLICNQVAYKYPGLRLDPMMLKGIREEYVDDDMMKAIEDCTEDVDFFMEHIEVIDSVSNPTGMYKYCRTFSEKVGKHYWKDVTFTKKGKDGIEKVTTEKVYDRYEPNDPNLHCISIGDHISLVTPEYDPKMDGVLSHHQTMAKWSTHYNRGQMTKHWGWTCVNVQQQEESSSKQQYTNRGESILEKTEPSLGALANNKEIQRDDYVVISLYSPDRFGFNEYHGYDIDRMRDTFRAIKILKNRLGTPNKYVHLIFDGATNQFKELPFPEEQETLNQAYAESDRLIGRKGI